MDVLEISNNKDVISSMVYNIISNRGDCPNVEFNVVLTSTLLFPFSIELKKTDYPNPSG